METENFDKNLAAKREQFFSFVNETDKKTPSPEQRAKKVYDILKKHKELDNWDLTCFCVEYIGSQVSVHPWLEALARKLTGIVYTAHYNYDEWKK